MVPVREKQSYDPQPWDGTESKLPGVCENGGYFLKADSGPKFDVGGTIVRPLATRKESNGKFSIYSIEGSRFHHGKGLEGKTFKFEKTHHVIQVTEGSLKVIIEGEEAIIGSMETIFVPAGKQWSSEVVGNFAKYFVFANGGGIGELLTTVGSPFKWAVVPEAADVSAWNEEALKDSATELGFVIV
jgi:mannose-6-phosphate isomerase-like protein (cupin superfamily)